MEDRMDTMNELKFIKLYYRAIEESTNVDSFNTFLLKDTIDFYLNYCTEHGSFSPPLHVIAEFMNKNARMKQSVCNERMEREDKDENTYSK